ncbi:MULTISPECIES: hypothetical protein [Actinomadura]|uniref:Uncharacterized protein n=1 Tax=Actinomadura yumaensis TaxID=111807 RepID=A0ABW2CLE2_9ACTN|nr:hypothetical protein [Actinomadura sp. J1-007]MWK37811.1 hypothetical protein [Actinomadura sp. J1-007]
MTTAPPKHSRGRHAKPPSEFTIRWKRLVRASVGDSRRRRLVAAGTGTAAVALLAGTAFAGLSADDSRRSPRAAVAAQTSRPSVKGAVETTRTTDPDEVPEAVPFFQSKDTGGKVAKHVKDVRRSGAFIRVYTDLGEGDENSPPAVSLCEWTTQFLKDGGDEEPRVFVHGKSSDNGSVVLANKQSDKDDCEVGETR